MEDSLTTIDLGVDGLDDAVEIGRGGFGSVYRARQTALQRTVAIKVLRDAVEDTRVRSRFERECWAMGTLAGHPNIITVHGSGFTDSGQPYIVMDFMPGGTLADRLDHAGPLPWEEVLVLGVKLAGALETAHRSGVLHRDIKPENVLISKYNEPQLADFGIARLQGREETKTDTLTASIAHVSPELLAGDPPSVSSDVYALGSTLFMLLKGQPAFIHDTDQSIVPALTRITSEPVPDLRVEGVPPAVCEVVEHLMAKDPATRCRTAEEAGRKLQACQDDLDEPVSALTITGEPKRAPIPDASATNAIPPEALAAAKAAALDGSAAAAAAKAGTPEAETPEAETPEAETPEAETPAPTTGAPDPDPGPASPEPAVAAPRSGRPTGRRMAKPALLGLAAVAVVVAAVLVGIAVVDGGDEVPGPDQAQPVPAGEDAPAEVPALLVEDTDLGEGWAADPGLEDAVTRPAVPYLCSDTAPETPPTVTGVAYRSGADGARVAHAVRVYPAGGAADFMADLDDQFQCLQDLPGFVDVAWESVGVGDEAQLVTYTRPQPERDLDVAVGFVRHDDAVAQVVHLGGPITDEALAADLMELAAERLAAQPADARTGAS